MMKLDKWDYYGDGVYAKPDNWGIWLHANDHEDPTDRIYLEWQVFKRLSNNIKALFKEAKNGRTEKV